MAPSANFSTDEKEASSIPEEFKSLDKYWRASNYLSVGQIYLYGKNPLLRRPLDLSDIKPRLLGHWGTVPGQNFIYCHLNRLIKKTGASMLYISGPGHGGNAQVAQSYLEGTYSEIYPNITQDEVSNNERFSPADDLRKFQTQCCKRFSLHIYRLVSANCLSNFLSREVFLAIALPILQDQCTRVESLGILSPTLLVPFWTSRTLLLHA
jgi:hypothetical protein